MATYKVIQDIEAEDKLVGPLTLRQLIYIGVFAVCAYISFLLIVKHVWLLLLVFVPVGGLAALLGFPWGRDQPTEIWLLAKIRFMFMPHRRLWSQSGLIEPVQITAPPKPEHQRTKSFSQTEVRSRLQALGETLDSRGWAIKDAQQAHISPAYTATSGSPDRLIGIPNLPNIPTAPVRIEEDVLDIVNNPRAQQFGQMIDASNQAHRKEILQNMQSNIEQQAGKAGRPAKNQALAGAATPTSGQSDNGAAFFTNFRQSAQLADQPFGQPPALAAKTPKPADAPMTAPPDADILNLAKSNDFDIATVARQANKKRQHGAEGDEIVVPLR